MEITNRIVQRSNLTTLMITHNMKQALVTGNSTIMMDSDMTMDGLLKLYTEKKKQEFTTDRILLSDQ